MKAVQGKKTSAQITKQLVQETLIDEGLRVVKELANQIRDDTNIHIPPPKPEGRPRGRPPKLDRDYSISTASATNAIHTPTSCSASMPATGLVSSGPPTPSAQNGRSPMSVNGPSENNSASHVDIMTVPITNGTSGLQHGTGNSDKSNDNSQSDTNKGSENSLNALLAFSQKGLIKQEPPSPTIGFKME
ncbi:uncharacterized protein LOC111615970 [Centruroides sculpturatus]|nr:uncharacterized protein LOC111615970 [Centruroides sculpturatus]